jgi:DNA-binding response OmpR family regulator
LRLLVTDCEETVAEIVATGLEVCCDAVVIRANNGMIAAQAVQTQRIDLAIIDTSLPDISGFELAEFVADRNVPALLISAHPRDQELLTRHRYPHLSKPFRLSALVGAVTTALSNAKENITNLHRAHAVLRGTDQGYCFYSATREAIPCRRMPNNAKGDSDEQV